MAFLSSHPQRTSTNDTPKLRQSMEDFQLASVMAHKPLVIDPDDNLIALVDSPRNRLEICKLVFGSYNPRLRTLSYLDLPPLKPNNHCMVDWAEKE